DVAIDGDGVVDLSSNGLTLYLPDLRVADMTLQGVINASDFRAHIPVDEAPMLGAEVSVRDIGVNPLPVIPRRPEFDARMELSHNQLGIDGLLRLAGIPLIEIDASHMLSSGSGSAQLQILPLHFDELFTNLG